MRFIVDLNDSGDIEEKLRYWATHLSDYLSYTKIGRYILDQNHAKMWVPELDSILLENGFKIDKAYLEVNKKTVNSDWQKFLPENQYSYALHVPIEGCENWLLEYISNTSMPAFNKLGIVYASETTSEVKKHYGYQDLNSMFIMRTDRQWRRTHIDRPTAHLSKSLLITLNPISA
jgi:hypothetical protein